MNGNSPPEPTVSNPTPNPKPTTRQPSQWRPLSRNPFEGLVGPYAQPSNPTQVEDANGESFPETTDSPRLAHPGPNWVNLFYDLAWNAAFASAIENGAFDKSYATGSFVVFTVIVWWMWATDTLYRTHYYTNDWFHLLIIALQLVIYGMLAATTYRFDVTGYISHSPGLARLRPMTTDEITRPIVYETGRIARLSQQTVEIAFIISRVLLLIQYTRVRVYACITSRRTQHTVPRNTFMIPVGFVISLALLVPSCVLVISGTATSVLGAILKLVFLSLAILAEVVAHILALLLGRSGPGDSSSEYRQNQVENQGAQEPQPNAEISEPPGSRLNEVNKGVASEPSHELPVPYSDVSLGTRLEAMVTIVLGEGINGIANALYSVLSVPARWKILTSNVACPTGRKHCGTKGPRTILWLGMHLLLLVSIALLLLGIRNLFLLMSFTSNAIETFDGIGTLFTPFDPDDSIGSNLTIKNYFLQRGITWATQWSELRARLTKNGTVPLSSVNETNEANDIIHSWSMGLSLDTILKLYQASPYNLVRLSDEIPAVIQDRIDQYKANSTWQLDDYNAVQASQPAESTHLGRIVNKLLKPSMDSSRYFMALAGLVLISLASINLAHSKPQGMYPGSSSHALFTINAILDPYQRGIVISRFAMGLVLVFLLLLNLGHQFAWGATKHEAGVFRWVRSFWPLQTIALAYSLEFLTETTLVWFASLATQGSPRKLLFESVLKPLKTLGRGMGLSE